ncbi:MAG: transposase domain-containing protein [Paracoccus sp. (in: a-proteobacteria)]|uniref:transposase domain-containing protein n=1 Tax=Paracoccus sp. TaxID=267 RepID=UPI0039E3B3F2
MTIPVKALCGIACIPTDRTAASQWLRRNAVPLHIGNGNGGRFEYVLAHDLPTDIRRAYELREIEAAGLPAGAYDDDAHDRLAEATPAMQATALRKAEIARFLVKGGAGAKGLPGLLCDAAREAFGPDGTDKMTLRRIMRAVEGVDPVNFAPALLPAYARETPAAEVSPEAWAFFMTAIQKAAPWYPLAQAWQKARDVAKMRSWQWPTYRTVIRRWDALTEAQKLDARHGRAEAVAALEMPIKRDKTSLKPLQMVSLDGRTQDSWVDFGDGKPVRPVMLALVDAASNHVLGYEIARSENAVVTARLIREPCKQHGIFDLIYTDNGSAFSGHLVAGGAKFKWRGKGKGQGGVKPLAVCFHLGIELTFAIPKNAKAKIAERTFAALSRALDDRPEFAGAHAGHAPGASPGKGVVPVPLALAEGVIAREIARHNAEPGRRGQGARGRSYAQIFQDGLAERIVRKPTARQIYLASLVYTPASVDRWGRVQIDNLDLWRAGNATGTACLARQGTDSDRPRSRRFQRPGHCLRFPGQADLQGDRPC